jgi:hypothetical protein
MGKPRRAQAEPACAFGVEAGANVYRYERLNRFVERRWSQSSPEFAWRLKMRLRRRYIRRERLLAFIQKRWAGSDPVRAKALMQRFCRHYTRRERLSIRYHKLIAFIKARWDRSAPGRAEALKRQVRNRYILKALLQRFCRRCTRYHRLIAFVEERWGRLVPDPAGYLRCLIRERYIDQFPWRRVCDYGEDTRRRNRSDSEIIAQEASREKRAKQRRAENRYQFLRDADTGAGIDLRRASRLAEGVSDSNRYELLFFDDHTRPEALMILAYIPPHWDRDAGPARTPGAIQLTGTEAYWWCTTGCIEWYERSGEAWRPLADQAGRPISDADGRPKHLSVYPGPDTGRIARWRRGEPVLGSAKPRWDKSDGKGRLFFGEILCRTYTKLKGNQIEVLDAFQAAGWPATIRFPLEFAGIGRTVADMNKELENASPIRFVSLEATGQVGWTLKDPRR